VSPAIESRYWARGEIFSWNRESILTKSLRFKIPPIAPWAAHQVSSEKTIPKDLVLVSRHHSSSRQLNHLLSVTSDQVLLTYVFSTLTLRPSNVHMPSCLMLWPLGIRRISQSLTCLEISRYPDMEFLGASHNHFVDLHVSKPSSWYYRNWLLSLLRARNLSWSW